MIILDATTRSLEVKLSGAITTNQLPIVASYVDIDTATPSYTPASANAATNNTTAVTVVAAPGAGVQRQVKLLTVRNTDTVSATVIIQYNDNATLREIGKFTMAADDVLVYTDGEGFRLFDNLGSLKLGLRGPGYTATSATSLATANSGSKSFTTQAGLAYTVGARIRATSTGTGDWMEGVVTSYSNTSLVATMDNSYGSGTNADWNINLAGEAGISHRVVTETDDATVTPNASITDFSVLASLSQTTTIANMSGTARARQLWSLTIISSTARTLNWGSEYIGTVALPLPTTTSGSSQADEFLFIRNPANTKWRLLAISSGYAS